MRHSIKHLTDFLEKKNEFKCERKDEEKKGKKNKKRMKLNNAVGVSKTIRAQM